MAARVVAFALQAMAPEREDLVYRPDLAARKQYDALYALYRQLADPAAAPAEVMRALRDLPHA